MTQLYIAAKVRCRATCPTALWLESSSKDFHRNTRISRCLTRGDWPLCAERRRLPDGAGGASLRLGKLASGLNTPAAEEGHLWALVLPGGRRRRRRRPDRRRPRPHRQAGAHVRRVLSMLFGAMCTWRKLCAASKLPAVSLVLPHRVLVLAVQPLWRYSHNVSRAHHARLAPACTRRLRSPRSRGRRSMSAVTFWSDRRWLFVKSFDHRHNRIMSLRFSFIGHYVPCLDHYIAFLDRLTELGVDLSQVWIYFGRMICDNLLYSALQLP